MSSRNLSSFRKFLRDDFESALIFEFYEYNIYKSPRDKPELKYLKCILQKSEGCIAKGTLTRGVFAYSKKFKIHNHKPDLDASDRLAFLHELQLASSSELCTPYGEIFSRIIEKERFNKFDRQIEFVQMVKRMRDWRAKTTLPEPLTYTAIEAVLASDKWKGLLKHRKGEIFMNSITAEDGKVGALFASRQVISQMPNIEAIYLTTHSLVLPAVNNTTRVMLITGVLKQRCLTLGWVLVSDDSRDLYRAIAEAIKTELILPKKPKKIITNYDWRLVTSIRQSFPLVDVSPSLCDFILTLLHFAHRQRGVDLDNEQHVKILTKFVANYLAVASEIRPGFEWIAGCINQQELHPIFSPVLEWYSDNFLGELVAESNSYYKKEHLLMNGTVRIPQRLKGKVLESPSPLWTHYKAHLEVIDAAVHDLSVLTTGDKKAQKNISMSPRLLSCIRLPLLRRLWQLMDEKLIEIDRFIQTVSFLLKPLMERLIFQRQFVEGNYSPMPPAEIPEHPDTVEIRRAELRNVRTRRDPNGLFVELNLTEVQRLARQNIPVPQAIIDALVEDEETRRDEEPDAADDADDGRQREWRCIKCNIRPVGMLCKGCAHVVLCETCTVAIRDEAAEAHTGLSCPQCQKAVSTFEKVFIGSTGNVMELLNWLCTICFENTISHMGIECKHISLCHPCATSIIRQADNRGCPQCRNDNRNDNTNPKPFIPVKFRCIQV